MFIKKISRLFYGYTAEKAQDIEIQCKTISYIAWVAAPTAAVFAIVNYYSGHTLLAIVEIVAIALLLPCFILPSHKEHLTFIKNLLMANAFIVFSALFFDGGIGSSGITWSLVFPFIAFLLMGLPTGWYWVISYCISISLLIYFHFSGYLNLPYDNDFLIFFPATFIFFSFVAAVLELQLERLHVKHEDLLNNLEKHVSDKTKALQAAHDKLKKEVEGHESTVHALQESEESEERLEHAQRMESIGTLVGGIAHDFNNMLTGITGNIFLAKRKLGDNANVMKHLESVETLSNRAADMIRQLLTFARKDSVKMKTFSITLFFNEALKLAQSAIPENIDLTQEISTQDMMIQGDSTQLQQLMMNLLNNARDAIANTPQPTIHCQLEPFSADDAFREKHPDLTVDEFARLTVSDNGHGIPQEMHARVFEPFFTTKGVNKGTGLGLSMLYGAVQRHHGIIELESELGKGATFHIYLPLEEQQAEASNNKVAEVTQGQGETILLVDDEELMRKATAEVLSSLGYNILEAADGEEALKSFKSNKSDIDLLITDLVMPKMGGFELTQAIRLLDENLPVIFATGYDKDHALEGDIHLDNSLVITKPFSFNELSQFIRIIINPK